MSSFSSLDAAQPIGSNVNGGTWVFTLPRVGFVCFFKEGVKEGTWYWCFCVFEFEFECVGFVRFTIYQVPMS